MKKIETLADLCGKDLVGWQVGLLYFLELEHHQWGTFPAMNKARREEICVWDKSLLLHVWQKIRERPARVSSTFAIGSAQHGIAFDLTEVRNPVERLPVGLYDEKRIIELCSKDDSVEWRPGLIPLSLIEEVIPPLFT